MNREKEILREQLQLLAKESQKCCPGDGELPGITGAMCEIYRLLKGEIALLAVLLAVLANSVVCFIILVKKLFGSK